MCLRTDVTADCDADGDAFDSHTETAEQAVAKVLRAGTDNDCGTFVTEHAMSALNSSTISECSNDRLGGRCCRDSDGRPLLRTAVKDIEDRLRMMFRVRMRLSHFDPIGPLQTIPTSVICSDEAKELARDGVTQAVAMLKNVDKTLPLSAATAKTVALIGPNAKLSRQTNFYAVGTATVCPYAVV